MAEFDYRYRQNNQSGEERSNRRDRDGVDLVMDLNRYSADEIRELLFELLDTDHKLLTSLEYVIESSPASGGRTEEYLILRGMSGIPPFVASDCMEEWQADQYALHLAGRENLILCVPSEKLRGIQECYVPGGYQQCVFPAQGKIRSIIEDSHYCGLAIQLVPTGYMQVETESIAANERWIEEAFAVTPETSKAREIFSGFRSMKDGRLYFAGITAWGAGSDLREIVKCFMACGFEIQDLPQDFFREYNYIRAGHNVLQQAAEDLGHFPAAGTVVPDGCQRLNFLTDIPVVKELVSRISADLSSDERESLRGKRGRGTVDRSGGRDRWGNRDNSGKNHSDYEHWKDSEHIYLGREVDSGEAVQLSLEQLTRHLVIAGMSGSGKTSMMFQLLLELEKKNIPFLVIEPIKTEYRELLAVMPELKVLTPGRTDVSPVMFNPFLPPKGITLEQFLPSLIAAFQMAFSLTTPLDVILPEVIRNCYVQYNWRNDSTRDSSDVTIFGMHEFICAFKEEVQNSTYDAESRQNLNSGGIYRFQSLVNHNPYLFDTDQSLDLDELLQEHTLIELDGIDNPEHKTLFLALLLLQLKLVIHRHQKKDGKLKNVIMLDEAHVLLDDRQAAAGRNEADPVGKLQEYLLDMVKENRVYGTGMIFADQSIAVLQEFVNHSNVKMVMRVEAAREREFVSCNLNLPYDAYYRIGAFKTGELLLSCDQLQEPAILRSEDVRTRYRIPVEMTDEEVRTSMQVTFRQPFTACPCKKGCDLTVRNEAEFIARKLCSKMAGLFKDKEALEAYMQRNLDDAIQDIVEQSDFDQEKRLGRCAKLMVERMIRTKVFFE